MKTAIEQMMEDLNDTFPRFFNVHSLEGRVFMRMATKYLSVEKEQIIKSVNDTIKRIKLDEDKTGFIAQNGEGYFNETYGGNK
jgi:hypothetical protein